MVKRITIIMLMVFLLLPVGVVYGDVEYAGNPSDISSPTMVNGIMLVNKKNPLPKSYVPSVTSIQGAQGTSEAVSALNKLISGAHEESRYEIRVISGYRSYDYQETLYNNYVKKDGKEKADKYSARPGYSEHQTGLTFDVLGGESTQLTTAFGDTPEGKWIAGNAYKYGYIVRYPKGKESITGYQYEPWHLRYIGVEKAKEFHDSGKGTLEEFLGIVDKVVSGSSEEEDTGEEGGKGGGGSAGESPKIEFQKMELGKGSLGVDSSESEMPKEVTYIANQQVKTIYKIMQVLMVIMSAGIVLYLGVQLAVVEVVSTGVAGGRIDRLEKALYGERKRDKEGKQESIYKLILRNTVIAVVVIVLVMGSFYIPLQGQIYRLIEEILLLLF